MAKNNLPTALRLIITPFLLVFIFTSCSGFFTSSLAPWAARDPENFIPRVNAGNVHGMIEDFENDPNASLVILKRIESALNNASPADAAELQAAALLAAANSVGLVNAVLGSIPSIDSINADNATQIVERAVGNMKNLDSASALLLSIVPDPGNTAAFNAFVAAAQPEDLAFAAVLILAGEAKNHPGGMNNYLNHHFTAASPASAAEYMAVKIAEAAVEGLVEEQGGGSTLEGFLNGLGLGK